MTDLTGIPWKPTGSENAPTRVGRIVRFPPVRSFGRLEQDKWLAIKTLEETAELVEASKRWLKPKDPNQLDGMLTVAARTGIMPSTIDGPDRTRLMAAWAKSRDTADREDMLSELADVIQTIANLIVAYDVTDKELADAMRACEQRNRERGRL